MKLSTKIKKYGYPWICNDGDTIAQEIILSVDCGKTESNSTHVLSIADRIHEEYKAKGYTLLPLNECPVHNQEEQIIMHYTSTTYREWCNC